MAFIKKHIFSIIRFASIWLTLFSIYNIITNKGDFESNVATFIVSLVATILVIMADFWYGQNE